MLASNAGYEMEAVEERILCSPLGPDKEIPDYGFAVTLFAGMKRRPSAIAMVEVFSERSVTFEECQLHIETVACQLLQLGCRNGDVVAIFSPNSINWVMTAASALRVGAAFAGINHLLTPAELRSQLQLSGAKFIYTTESLATVAYEAVSTSSTNVQTIIVDGHLDRVQRSCPSSVNVVSWSQLLDGGCTSGNLPSTSELRVCAEDVAMILFSSGTTGPQKAVMLSHRNIHTQLAISGDSRIRKIKPNEIMFAPFAHVKGCLFTLFSLAVGYTTYIMSRFNLSTYLRLVSDLRIESLSVVPAIAIALAKSPEVAKYDLSNLREIVCGTAPLRNEVSELLCQRFPGLVLRQAYGLTETASIVTNFPDDLTADIWKTKSGSVGVPVYNVQMKVVDIRTGATLDKSVDGEICVRSPLVMVGYAGNPDATAAAIDRQGWLHTGDIGHYDQDHFLYVVDRIKELIKYKSYQVAPAELESVLLAHPDVADVGVGSIPDATAGELPVAFVVRREGSSVTESEIQAFVAEHVAPYKRLRGGVRFISAVPRSPAGKILRRQFKTFLAQSHL